MAQRTPTRYWIVIGTTQGLAALAVFLGAVYFWSTSLLPLAVFLGVMVLPTAFYAAVGAFAIDPTRTKNGLVDEHSPTVGRRLILATTPVLVFGTVFSAGVLTFQLPEIRTSMVEIGSSHGFYHVAEAGLFDDDADVRLASCRAVATHSAETSTPALAQAMNFDDNLADCALESMGPAAADIMLEFHTSRWETELMSMSPDDPPERACQLSQRLFHADRIGLVSAVPRLLTCTTGADAPAARQCCAQSLVTAKADAPSVAEIMPAPQTFASSNFLDRLPDYMQASRVDPTQSVEVALGLTSVNMAAWMMRTSCAGLALREDLRYGLTERLASSVDSPTCEAPEVNPTTLRLWQRACESVPAETSDAELGPAICQRANELVLNDTMLAAETEVVRALARAKHPQRARNLTHALLNYIAPVSDTKSRTKHLPDMSALLQIQGQLDGMKDGSSKNIAEFIMNLSQSGQLGVPPTNTEPPPTLLP